MIEIVSATRKSKNDFWNESPLGLSMKRFIHRDSRLSMYIAYENQHGLPEIFNERINTQNNSEILLFIHDDVWINDHYFVDRVYEGLNAYDVIGILGNRRRVRDQPSWLFKSLVDGKLIEKDKKLIREDKEYLSGSAALGTDPFGRVYFFGTAPAECELLDGIFLATKKSTLKENEILFDPKFDFHFYDMDFCRSMRAKGLRLGTWPICITHKSTSDFNSHNWYGKFLMYREKWEM